MWFCVFAYLRKIRLIDSILVNLLLKKATNIGIPKCKTWKYLSQNSGGSRIFLRRGGANSQSGSASLFFWKWSNLDPNGVRYASREPPLWLVHVMRDREKYEDRDWDGNNRKKMGPRSCLSHCIVCHNPSFPVPCPMQCEQAIRSDFYRWAVSVYLCQMVHLNNALINLNRGDAICVTMILRTVSRCLTKTRINFTTQAIKRIVTNFAPYSQHDDPIIMTVLLEVNGVRHAEDKGYSQWKTRHYNNRWQHCLDFCSLNIVSRYFSLVVWSKNYVWFS